MRLTRVKDHSADLLGTGKNQIWIDPEQLDRLSEVITKDDIRELISERVIRKKPSSRQSRGRTRLLKEKTRKGRKGGYGKRKGSKKARVEKKKRHINKVRSQRKTLKQLRKEKPEVVEGLGYSRLYRMIKGNYFKGKNYLIRMVEAEEKK